MTNEAQNQAVKIVYLYRIINKINSKIYIGQSVNPRSRWYAHKSDAAKDSPIMAISKAIKKYGDDAFEFEVIAACKNWEDANETETELISQYNSLIKNGKGYNVALGGFNAPKSEEFKQMMRDWHASLSPEEKEARSKMHADAIFKQIEENGHPATGRIVTEEEKELHRKSRLENPLEYTPELRKKMSEAHIGIKDTEETKLNKSESASSAWEDRFAQSDEVPKCSIDGCDIAGFRQTYIVLDGIRYCSTHGQRMRRHGTTEKLPAFKYTEDNPMPDDVRKRCGAANIGRAPHNRITFSE